MTIINHELCPKIYVHDPNNCNNKHIMVYYRLPGLIVGRGSMDVSETQIIKNEGLYFIETRAKNNINVLFMNITL